MSLIDVAIPGVAGLLMVCCPSAFIKRKRPTDVADPDGGEDGELDDKRAKLRMMGFALLGVAVMYAVIK